MIFQSLRINRIVALAALGVAAVLTACGGQPPDAPDNASEPGVYDPAVSPITENVDAYLAIANPLGVNPCGVFDVNGHGEKIVTLSDYSGCEATDYTVYCLTGDAQWTDEFVSSLSVEDGTVRFTSAQEGICALFPAD